MGRAVLLFVRLLKRQIVKIRSIKAASQNHAQQLELGDRGVLFTCKCDVEVGVREATLSPTSLPNMRYSAHEVPHSPARIPTHRIACQPVQVVWIYLY